MGYKLQLGKGPVLNWLPTGLRDVFGIPPHVPASIKGLTEQLNLLAA